MHLDDLARLPDGVVSRWATAENPLGIAGRGGMAKAGRKGAAWTPLEAGEQRILAEASGSGVLRRMWLTFWDRSPTMLRALRIDIWWDGCATPAVSVPLGDFFGIGLGRIVPFENALCSSPEGRSFNLRIPMPFRTAMRVAITNESDRRIHELYYDLAYTLGDRHDGEVGYLHAHWRRERRTTLRQDYEFLPRVTGRGRFLGVNVGVIADRDGYAGTWWGEGEAKIYLDGDREWPTLCGTGTEDYVGTAWELGSFVNQHQGCPIADHQRMRFCFYRWHVVDPVWFHREVRATMQQMGNYGPEAKQAMLATGRRFEIPSVDRQPLAASSPDGGLLEREDDWSSCAYFYLDRPSTDLPALPPVAERIAGVEASG